MSDITRWRCVNGHACDAYVQQVCGVQGCGSWRFVTLRGVELAAYLIGGAPAVAALLAAAQPSPEPGIK